MPELYAASINPPRRAKRAPPAETNDDQPIASTTTTTTTSSPRALLPMRPYAPRTAASAPELAEAPPPPAKRGRKPGPLSRTAREAQRRLNHSIIEKARRTKINDALAALKQLVPANYGKAAEAAQEPFDEEDDNDEDYEEGGKTAKLQPAAGKGKGKKEEKEKEFKLEILIRTVSFLQDLLQRVNVLEAAAASKPAQSVPVAPPPAPASQPTTCPSCNASLTVPRRRQQGKKRKRAPVGRHSDGYSSDDDDRDGAQDDGFAPPRPLSSAAPPARRAKIARRSTVPSPPSAHAPAPQPMGAPPSPRIYPGTTRPRDGSGSATASPPTQATPSAASARLPPISAWLDCVLDPQLPGAPRHSPPSDTRRVSASPRLGVANTNTSSTKNNNSGNSNNNGAYLPSPPSSTRFAPECTTHAHPPFLSLGPVATAALVGPPASTIASGLSPTVNNITPSSSSARTPEDESAASLLLQIAASPPFRAVRSTSFSSAASASSSSAGAPPTPTQTSLSGSGAGAARGDGKWSLADPSGFSLQGSTQGQGYARGGGGRGGGGGGQPPPQVQTPSSLLGLDLGAVGGPLLRY